MLLAGGGLVQDASRERAHVRLSWQPYDPQQSRNDHYVLALAYAKASDRSSNDRSPSEAEEFLRVLTSLSSTRL